MGTWQNGHHVGRSVVASLVVLYAKMANLSKSFGQQIEALRPEYKSGILLAWALGTPYATSRAPFHPEHPRQVQHSGSRPSNSDFPTNVSNVRRIFHLIFLSFQEISM